MLLFLSQKKRLTNKLGPQWTKVELERFYEAYRKHGRDWKKVSFIVCDYFLKFCMTSTFLILSSSLETALGSCCSKE